MNVADFKHKQNKEALVEKFTIIKRILNIIREPYINLPPINYLISDFY